MTDLTGALPKIAEDYLIALVHRDPAFVASRMNLHAFAYYPVDGLIVGHQALAAQLAAGPSWLADREAQLTVGPVTHQGRRAVIEAVITFPAAATQAELPVAAALELDAHGMVSQVRLYHSSLPTSGRHQIRTPSLRPDPALTVTGPAGAYLRALREGDVDAIVAVFSADGYAREPSGGDYLHRGPEALQAFYTALLADGGLPLAHCSLTDDGMRTAVEYSLSRWGRTYIPLQSGLAVYERADDDHLAAARIYDDIAAGRE